MERAQAPTIQRINVLQADMANLTGSLSQVRRISALVECIALFVPVSY